MRVICGVIARGTEAGESDVAISCEAAHLTISCYRERDCLIQRHRAKENSQNRNLG